MRSGLVQADDATSLADVIRDPVRFCLGLLRQDLWPLQEAILRAIASRPRVAVKACHASGKTFVAAVAEVRRTALVVHDYGVSVGQELLARRSDGTLEVDIPVIVFLNGGLYPEVHRPQPAQLMLLDPEQGPRMGDLMTEELFGRGLSRTFSPSHQPSAAELHELWLSVVRRDGHRIGHRLIQYIPDRRQHRDRWVGALETASVPRHFMWGDLDPVSGAHMADRIAAGIPGADLIRLSDVGHWPQLEAPDTVVDQLERMLG